MEKARRIITLVKEEPTGSKARMFGYSASGIANLLGMNEESIRVRARRGKIDLSSLEAVARYIVKKLERKKDA